MKSQSIVRRCGFLLLFGIALAGPVDRAEASFVNLTRVGDLIVDTVSDRKWLALTESTNHSYDQMVDEFGCQPTCTSGPFAGFTFASTADVEALFTDAGLWDFRFRFNADDPLGSGVVIPSSDADAVSQFIAMIGMTLAPIPGFEFAALGMSIDLGTINIFGEEFTRVLSPAAVFDDVCTGRASLSLTGDNCPGGPRFPTEAYADTGVWLFKVPEPATLSLLWLSVLAMGFGMRRRGGFVSHRERGAKG